MPRRTTSQADDLIVRKNHKIDNKLGWTKDLSCVFTYGESLKHHDLTGDIWEVTVGRWGKDELHMVWIICQSIDPQINLSTLEIR